MDRSRLSARLKQLLPLRVRLGCGGLPLSSFSSAASARGTSCNIRFITEVGATACPSALAAPPLVPGAHRVTYAYGCYITESCIFPTRKTQCDAEIGHEMFAHLKRFLCSLGLRRGHASALPAAGAWPPTLLARARARACACDKTST